MCIGPTSRHLRRSTVVPNSSARSSMTCQCEPRTSKPPVFVAPSDSSEAPNRPARRGPDGDTCAATAISKHGSEYGRSWSRASFSVNQSVILRDRLLAVEQLVDRLEGLLHHVPLLRATSMPIMKASDGSAPGPTPNITRPRVRWSSRTMRSASISGWW